ncbi:hypothetical protein [Bradyrhizobium sp. RT6a]|uniref:hypothetical protein n=1 Tax=unclassified Bradyrhizobium TaxID=2631580 RepID=UPI0033972F67
MRNHKPEQWTKGDVQMLIKMINVGSTAGEIATEPPSETTWTRAVMIVRSTPAKMLVYWIRSAH